MSTAIKEIITAIKKIIREYPYLLLAMTGAVLVLVAAFEKIELGSVQLSIAHPLLRASTLATGLLFVLIAFIFAVRNPSPFRIRITDPTPEQTVEGNFIVKGTFTKISADDCFRLFITSVDGNTIWPQGHVAFSREANTWRAEASLWENPRDHAFIIIAKLGEAGRILYSYYSKVGESTGK